jgi:hypothetical protein
MDDRDRRRALNEATFRRINERLQSVNETFGTRGRISVVCECDDAACLDQISLAPEDYARVRAEPVLFVVRPGHESPAVESVIADRGEYRVVRKRVREPTHLAVATEQQRD